MSMVAEMIVAADECATAGAAGAAIAPAIAGGGTDVASARARRNGTGRGNDPLEAAHQDLGLHSSRGPSETLEERRKFQSLGNRFQSPAADGKETTLMVLASLPAQGTKSCWAVRLEAKTTRAALAAACSRCCHCARGTWLRT